MKKLLFASFIITASVLAGWETQASDTYNNAASDEPCFSSYDSWHYCPSRDLYIAGYPQEDGVYYYYSWQCPTWTCPL